MLSIVKFQLNAKWQFSATIQQPFWGGSTAGQKYESGPVEQRRLAQTQEAQEVRITQIMSKALKSLRAET